MTRTTVAIIGSGIIGTDLMIKVLRLSGTLEMAAMVGIDPASDRLARAARLKVPTTYEGVDGLIAMPEFASIEIRTPPTIWSGRCATTPSRSTARP
jgi:acetaldehyde dehydrogenase